MKNGHLTKGTVLENRYTVEKTLGQGGFGITYLAYDEELRGYVVVKEYFPSQQVFREEGECEVCLLRAEDEALYQKGRRRFLEEARVMASLWSVPEIARVLGYFRQNGTAYLVMEYVRGTSLRAYGERLEEPPDFEACKTLLLPVIRAMEAVHKKGLLHRDITPDNLLIKEDGSIKVIDFGSAREYGEDDRTKTVLVKAGYAPLEQYSPKAKQGPWTDVYSLCAVFYELLTGAALPDALERAGGEEVFPPSLYGAELTAEEEAVLMKGLEPDAKERLRSMTALRTALFPEEAAAENAKKRRLYLVPVASALVLAAVAWGFFAADRGAQMPETRSLAGKYDRGSARYEEFTDFIKKEAVSAEDTEAGILYRLSEQAVTEWEEPCSQPRFLEHIGELQSAAESFSGNGRWSEGEAVYTAEIGAYGKITTYFKKELDYADDRGILIRADYDPLSGELLEVDVRCEKNGREALAETAAEIFEFLTDYAYEDRSALEKMWRENEEKKREKQGELFISFSWMDLYVVFAWSEERQDVVYRFLPFAVFEF